ncbi:MAG: hypothetical protein AAFR65_02410 [Pseudomonadota bacterium]
MTKFILPLAVASVALAGCVIDAGGGGFHDDMSLQKRTNLATEACGQGNVKSVSTDGFTCKED